MAANKQPEGRTLAGRYSTLEEDRQPYLDRARDAAKLTIPTLIPEAGSNKSSKFKTPYQSIGAFGVNNLAAKLTMAMLTPNAPFFRLMVDELTMRNLVQDPSQVAAVNEGLAKIERSVQQSLEGSMLRPKVSEAMKHLVVAGNVLLFKGDKNNSRIYTLPNYVVKRDSVGNVIEGIAKESISPLALEPSVLAACDLEQYDDAGNTNKEVDLYTGIALRNGKYEVYQELNGKIVPGSNGTYPLDKNPWIFLRFFTMDGESYGRSYVEEYLGDLQSLEGLEKAIVQGAAAASKVLFLVKPGTTTSKRELSKASNGSFVTGKAEDVTALQMQKFADFQTAVAEAQKIEARLARAFLMNSSIQRNGERVTAEEIRYMAQELEDMLGGIYSILSTEFQKPLVNVEMAQMQKAGVLPPLPKDTIKIQIVTGLDALGRGQDADRLRMFINDLVPFADQAMQYVNVSDLISRLAVARGIDTEGLIKSAEQIAQEQQAAQMNQFMADAGVAAAPQVARGMVDQTMAQQGAPQ